MYYSRIVLGFLPPKFTVRGHAVKLFKSLDRSTDDGRTRRILEGNVAPREAVAMATDSWSKGARLWRLVGDAGDPEYREKDERWVYPLQPIAECYDWLAANRIEQKTNQSNLRSLISEMFQRWAHRSALKP